MRRLLPAVLPAAILIVWSAASAFHAVDPLFLPAPWDVGNSFLGGIFNGELVEHTIATLARSLAGFALSVLIGVPLGLLVGRIRVLDIATQPTVDFLRSVPATAIFPLFLFAFGLGNSAKLAVVVYAAALIILVNTAYGARQVKAARLLSATVMGAGRTDLFWRIILPESTPGIFAGLRIGLSLSFVLIIVTEMFIGTALGLGYYILNSQLIYRTADMYAGILLAGILGYIANVCLLRVERRFLHWVGR